MKRPVKRILRKTGCPPDLQDQAIETVIKQAEALAAEITLRERERAMGR
jgi:type I restriction enzyme R subunit